MYCLRQSVPDGIGLIAAIQEYEQREQRGRA
jgi:hypothetical protein